MNDTNEFSLTFDRAVNMGRQAAEVSTVEMLKIVGYDPFPACGFAMVVIKPANCAFAKWLIKTERAEKRFDGPGVYIWIGDYNQCYSQKKAHAEAMARYFRDIGLDSYARSWLD